MSRPLPARSALWALAACALLLACGGGSGTTSRDARARPLGGIAGLVRDHDTGDPVQLSKIRVRATGELGPAKRVTETTANGLFRVDDLPAGRYALTAEFAGKTVEIYNIAVRDGEVTVVDVVFLLSELGPVRIDFSAPKPPKIDRYRPANLAAHLAIVEGTLTDSVTLQRVEGAIVTAVGPGAVEQAATDAAGRFRFEHVQPGTYTLIAYYSVSGRGQIEVRRSDIAVAGGEITAIELWIEVAK